jgi:hypothetical protein
MAGNGPDTQSPACRAAAWVVGSWRHPLLRDSLRQLAWANYSASPETAGKLLPATGGESLSFAFHPGIGPRRSRACGHPSGLSPPSPVFPPPSEPAPSPAPGKVLRSLTPVRKTPMEGNPGGSVVVPSWGQWVFANSFLTPPPRVPKNLCRRVSSTWLASLVSECQNKGTLDQASLGVRGERPAF